MGVRIPLDIETRVIIGEEIAKIEDGYYTKEEVDQKIEESNLYKVTNKLPEVGEPNLLYIVPITIFTNPGDPVHPPEGRTYYWDEELLDFVLIGSFQDISELDTSDFYTKEEIDSQFIAVEEDPVFSNWQMSPNVKIGTLAQSPANTANIAIGAQSIAYTTNPTGNRGVIAIGVGAEATGGSYAAGEIPDTETEVNGTVFTSIALGMSAKATADDTIQLGKGTNANPYTFQVGDYTLLNTVSGKIPIERLPANNEALENQPIIVLEQLAAISLGTAKYNINLKGNTETKYQVYCNYKSENTYVVFTPDDYTTVDGTYAADDVDELFSSLTQEQIDQILPGLLEGLGVTTLDEYKALFDYTQYIIPLDPARITYGFDVLIVPYGTTLDTGFRQKSLYTKQYHAGDDIQWMLTDSYGKLPDGYDGYARLSQVPPYREIYRKIDILDDTCTVLYRFAGNTENSLWLVTDLDETVVTGVNLVGSPFTDYTYTCSLEQATSEITVYFITNTDWANRANNIYWNDTFFAVSEFIKYKDRLNIVNERVGGEFRVVNDYSDQQTVAKYTTNEKTINLTDIKVGDDLSGATIHFNPNNLPIVLASDAGLSGFQWIIWTPVGGLNFGVVWNECFIQDADMNYLYHVTETNSDPTTLYIPNWIQDTYTFPQGAVVQSLSDLNGNRQSWEDFEIAMADNSWRPSMATVDVHFPAISIGDPNDDLTLTGKAERPSYKGNDIAFVSDIDTSDENPIIFETGDTMYQMSVLIPTVERPNGTLASLVDANELTAHAAHDEQMFNDLNAAILNNQFTPEQIQSIVNQAIDAADGELVTDTELDSAIKDAKNYADNLQYRQVIQIAKEEIDWASQRTVALSKTTTDFTVNGGDTSYAGAHVETTWTADRDCYIYVKFSIYSPQAANTANLGGSNMRVFVGVDGKETYNRAETLGNGQWAGWTWPCFRKVSEGQVIDIRSSKEQAIGYAVGSFSMQTFDIKTDALDGLDQKADKYFIDATRPQNFGDLVTGTDLSGMTIELPTLDISNPQNLAAVKQLQFTSGGKLSFVLSDDGTVTISAFDASQTGTTLYAAGTSPLVPSVPTYTFPAGSIVDTLDPTIFDVLGGDWKEQLLFLDLPEVSYKDEVTIEDLYDMIGEGANNIPRLLQKEFSSTGVTYVWRGDTREILTAETAQGSSGSVFYVAASDTTMYMFGLPATVTFYMGGTEDTDIIYVSADLSAPVTEDDLVNYVQKTDIVIDAAPTQNSTNLVESGGVYDAIEAAIPDNAIGIYQTSGNMDFGSANGSIVCRLEVDNLLVTLSKLNNYCSFRVQSLDGTSMTLNTTSIQYYDGASGQLKNTKVTISGETYYEFDNDVGYGGKSTGRAIVQNVITGIQYSILAAGASTTTATDRSDRYSLAIMPWESVVFHPNKVIDKNDLPGDIVYFDNVDAVPTKDSGNLVASGGVYNFVDQRVEKYYDDLPVTKTFADLVIGDDLSGATVSFPDPIDITNTLNVSTNSTIITFTNGYYVNLAANTVQTPAYFRLIDTNGQTVQMFYENSKTPAVSSYTFPDGFVISNIDRAEIDQFYGGSWQTQLVFNNQVEGEVTIKWLYDQIIALQSQSGQTTTDLVNHVLHDADLYQAILIAAREEAQAIYDGTNVPLSTTGTAVIGTGGVLALGSNAQYIVPQNGGITITFSAVLALGNVQVYVNGNSVFDSSAISLLAVPAPTTVRVNTGDVITTSGSLGLLSSLSVVFYPNKPI